MRISDVCQRGHDTAPLRAAITQCTNQAGARASRIAISAIRSKGREDRTGYAACAHAARCGATTHVRRGGRGRSTAVLPKPPHPRSPQARARRQGQGCGWNADGRDPVAALQLALDQPAMVAERAAQQRDVAAHDHGGVRVFAAVQRSRARSTRAQPEPPRSISCAISSMPVAVKLIDAARACVRPSGPSTNAPNGSASSRSSRARPLAPLALRCVTGNPSAAAGRSARPAWARSRSGAAMRAARARCSGAR